MFFARSGWLLKLVLISAITSTSVNNCYLFCLLFTDLLAVPDFLIGAMENWGLVMFRRIHLVYDQRFSSTDTKLSITKVIAHELAHQVMSHCQSLFHMLNAGHPGSKQVHLSTGNFRDNF